MELIESAPWPVMASIACMLGIRHGFDLDHLSTIDAITRTQSHRPSLSRWVGTLFSLGHGIVVTFAAAILSCGLVSTHIPEWIDSLGKVISIFFLLTFGALTLWNVLFSKEGKDVPFGIKSFLAKKLSHQDLSPKAILAIGALFALSFDTLSQVALFAMTGSISRGIFFSGMLGLFFTLGMIVADGLNGFIVAALIQKAGKMSSFFSKGLGLAISMFSFYLAIEGVVELMS